jgi:hypothetical protein
MTNIWPVISFYLRRRDRFTVRTAVVVMCRVSAPAEEPAGKRGDLKI